MPTAQRIAFVSPRFPAGRTAGGAETLLKSLAVRAAAAGRDVTFLTTCATDHFTWKNDLPTGERTIDGLRAHFFPVDQDRNTEVFLQIQRAISRGSRVSDADEQTWLANSVNSRALYDHVRQRGGEYDRIVVGPYLFGTTYSTAQIHPARTVLVPCLHDEPFARLAAFRKMFLSVGSIMFNTEPERDLAVRLYGTGSDRCSVVGTGMDAFDADPRAFTVKHGLESPYVIYCGRREALKGTPMLLDYFNAFKSRTGRKITLVLTGSGPIEIPPGLEPHVLDTGFLSEADKHDAMAGAVTFCHPSANESLSIVLLESWLAGTPALVAARSSVMRWQCERSGGGLWFRTYPEFEEELLLMLDNGALRSSMGQCGRQYVLREYAQERIDERLFAALDR